MKNIAAFLESDKYAIAGVSRNPRKFGHIAFTALRKKGMDVLPVNPNNLVIDGIESYKSVTDLPSDVKALIIITDPKETLAIAREAISKGIKNIWVQQGAESKKILTELEKEDINLISKECILMFWKPKGMHAFHRFLKKITGHLPS